MATPVAGDVAMSPDDLRAWRTAVTDTRGLLAGAQVLAVDTSRLSATARALATDDLAHLQALGAPVRPPGGAQATSTPAGSSTTTAGSTRTPQSRAARKAAAHALIDAENSAARAAATASLSCSPALATLLARIAASRAVHARQVAEAAGLPAPVLAPTLAEAVAGSPAVPGSAGADAAGLVSGSGEAWRGLGAGEESAAEVSPPPLTDTDLVAVGQLLDAEHAATYAYGLVTARIDAAGRAQAASSWTAHRHERDLLASLVDDQGYEAPASLPGYRVGLPPAAGSRATAFAAALETQLAAVAASATATPTPAGRRIAVAVLLAAVSRAASWGARTPALPGAPLPGTRLPRTSGVVDGRQAR